MRDTLKMHLRASSHRYPLKIGSGKADLIASLVDRLNNMFCFKRYEYVQHCIKEGMGALQALRSAREEKALWS